MPQKRTISLGVALWISILLLNNSLLLSKHFIKTNTPDKYIQLQYYPAKIGIEKINLDLPLSLGSVENGYWILSNDNIMYIPPTNSTGTIIYGHNKAHLFKNLSKLKTGDTFNITNNFQSVTQYQIYQIDTVSPDQINSLETDQSQIVLYTCTGFLDTKRLVIKAKPIT